MMGTTGRTAWGDRVSTRVRAVGGGAEHSPFLRMLALAKNIPDVISLGRGDPDLPTPDHIVKAAQQALVDGKTKYTAPAGLDQLRTAVAQKLKADNGLEYDAATEIVITTGTQEAINVIFQTLLDPGDEVLLPDPYYMAHRQAISGAGGTPVTIRTSLEDNFIVQPEAVEVAITPRTKAILLTSPSNPTGSVIDPETAEAISVIAQKHDLVVISDELYEKLVYDNAQGTSIAGLPNMWGRTITVNGFSKAYNMTGMRVGYFAAPAAFVDAALEIRHMLTICTPTVSQWAALAALTGPQTDLQETLATYAERRQFALEKLSAFGVPCNQPQGAFFVFSDIRSTGYSSFDFCARLLQERHVMVFPGTQYGDGGEGFVRISFLAPIPQLHEALERFGDFYRAHAQ